MASYRTLDQGGVDQDAIDALDPVLQRALDAKAKSLLPQLQGEDRASLAQLLEHRGAVDGARRDIRSHRSSSRAHAGELLGDIGAVGALPDLMTLLRDRDPEVRWAAARSLGRIGSPRAVEPLLACLASGPAAVRAQAVLALGRQGAAEAVPALRRLLLDPAHTLSEQSAQALAAISPLGTAVLAQEAESDGYAGRTARQALEAAREDQTGLLSSQY